MSYAVEMRRITKRFGPVTALDDVSLAVIPGTIHAIVGENGAGKSTLVKALYGAHRPDSGEIVIRGHAVTIANSAQALALNIGMVSQHYGIIGELSVLDNLTLGAEGGPFPDRHAARRRAESLAARLGTTLDWDAPAHRLSAAAAQRLEILKLLWRDAKIMILDEPTAMLSPADSDRLFESLRTLVAEGTTILLVTHRLPEVMAHCQRVTVLRQGRLTGDFPVSETDPDQLTEAIIGRRPIDAAARAVGETVQTVFDHGPNSAPIRLRVTDLALRGTGARAKLAPTNLSLPAGEVIGIAGVDGSGQAELFQALLGVAPHTGRLEWNGADISATSTRERLALGFRIIAEDRLAQAVVPDWSVLENAVLGLHRHPAYQRQGWIRPAPKRDWARRVADQYQARYASVDAPMSSLSGGNQQRVVVARATESDPQLILAFQPSRGLDLGAIQAVYTRFLELAAAGSTVLVVSFDLEELQRYCHRAFVMYDGQLAEAPDLRSETLGAMMLGQGFAPRAASPEVAA
ncbi:MAG: ABC transporter ATP-binding protein [Fimbriimonadaceae bacterium]|nr:ABC transporter ATP-binding protein [Fimbriimonadaceae bacterium]